MTTFKQYLTEGYKNLFTPIDKKKYAKEAFEQLQKAYAKIGGIKGNGFRDEEDFIKNIPFWKLRLSKDGKLLAAAYYKDTAGRKRVAISSDGSREGKKIVADIMISDLTQGRAYAEQSEGSLAFLAKQIGYDEIKKHAIPFKAVAGVIGKPVQHPLPSDHELRDHPQLKSFLYSRMINGELITKLAVGKPGKELI
jgi:hypothetical protein